MKLGRPRLDFRHFYVVFVPLHQQPFVLPLWFQAMRELRRTWVEP